MTTGTEPTTSAELLERIDHEWRPLRDTLAQMQADVFDQPLTMAGGPIKLSEPMTVREAVAIVAFWVETAPPVIAWMRGEPLPWEAWYGGTERWEGWPRDAVHHSREAAWARAQSAAVVLARLDAAHARAIAAVATLTENEIRDEHDLSEFGRMRIVYKIHDCMYGSYASLTAALPCASPR